ncbi:DUF2490 domain-containing protein [Sphingobium sp. 3R8]|uniref:DUF2490 domain-containing protein n=1 Tax=Sphingobium sp. 3R8 TaxID=2874921 RepID=UPI001CCC2AF0|nr:DUF2490 domain-containing protein [Sphingobium sp. 3R8]MBZ9647306.1 DUF2490 domain-containing protein [Sphingobium sp. 3R8]
MKRAARLLTIPLGVLGASPAGAATEETQAWSTEQAILHAGESNIITIDSSQRLRSDGKSGGEQFLARVVIDHRITPALQLGGGIAYLRSEVDQEMRLFQQATLASGIWTSRTRIEQRFFDNADHASWRLRQRVQMAAPIDRAKRWTVIAATEIFFHLNRARPNDQIGLATMRNQVGLRHPIARTVDAQLLYMRQQNFRDGRPDTVAHIPWLTLSWRL